MNDLINVLNSNGVLTVTSREVASNFEKLHKDVLSSIRNLINQMNSAEKSAQYFISSEYKDGSGKSNPEYLLTRDGFSLLVMGFTGQKAMEWKIKYIDAFNIMEKQVAISKPSCIEDVLIESLHEMKNMRLQVQVAREETAAVKEEVNNIREVITINPKEDWRKDTNAIIAKICKKLNDYKLPKEEAYRALEQRANCKLKIRLENMRGRVLKEGMSRSKADALNYLDVISEDTKLIEIYIAIVKEMAIRHGITVNQPALEGR